MSTLQNKFMDGSGEIDNGEALCKAQKNNTVSPMYNNGFFNMLHWADLFKEQGFVAIDALRTSIWNDTDISFWYRQNILFFCSRETLANNEKLAQVYHMTNPAALSLVHPEKYLQCNTKSQRTVRHILTSIARIRVAKSR